MTRFVPITRRAFLTLVDGGTLGALCAPQSLHAVMRQGRPRPSPAQLRWQRDALALFVHFGINTFTDREWGDGTESPSLFDPLHLDARHWARVAREAGAKGMILTAKHHGLLPVAHQDHRTFGGIASVARGER